MHKIFLYRFTELFRLIRLLGCGELDKSGIMGKIVPDHSTFGKHNSISKPNVTGGDVAAAVQQRKPIAAMVNGAHSFDSARISCDGAWLTNNAPVGLTGALVLITRAIP